MSKGIAQSFLDTLELRKGSVITRQEVACLKKRWRPMGQHRATRCAEYEAFMEGAPYQCDAESTAAGLAWWTRAWYTPKGKVRETKFVKDECSSMDVTIPDVLANFSRFELAGWEFFGNGYGVEWMFPAYEMFAQDGRSFMFIARPWQSDGNCLGGNGL